MRDDFAVLSGYDEYLLPNLLAGGAGVISGLNNIVSELFAAAMRAWRAQDLCRTGAHSETHRQADGDLHHWGGFRHHDQNRRVPAF
nr:putative alkylphosphonate utilization operon proteinPhnA [Candidatus Pantoea persica]